MTTKSHEARVTEFPLGWQASCTCSENPGPRWGLLFPNEEAAQEYADAHVRRAEVATPYLSEDEVEQLRMGTATIVKRGLELMKELEIAVNVDPLEDEDYAHISEQVEIFINWYDDFYRED